MEIRFIPLIRPEAFSGTVEFPQAKILSDAHREAAPSDDLREKINFQ
jgi:hypothetical protein